MNSNGTARRVLAVLAVWPALLSLALAGDDSQYRVPVPVESGTLIEDNLCRTAEVATPSTAVTPMPLDNLIDGDISTGIKATLSTGDRVEIRFPGRPPWVNRVRAIHQENLSYELRVHDLYNTEREISYDRVVTELGDGTARTEFVFDDIRLAGFVLILESVTGLSTEGDLLEVEAFFRQNEKDDGTFDVGVEYVQYYKNKPCPNNDIPKTKTDATDFANKLRDNLGWTKRFTWGNSCAWERDFNTNDNTWADDVDFCYFAGHGSAGKIHFSHKYSDCNHSWSESQGRWGDDDMEWFAAASCQVIKDRTHRSRWHKSFDHLHLMCGWETNMKDVNLGKPFGDRAVRKKHKIYTSWINAAKETHGGSGSKKRAVVIIGEVRDNFNDHVWGAGYVSPDPTYDKTYWYARSEWTSSKAPAPAVSLDRDNAELISVPGGDGPPILVPTEVLSTGTGRDMPELMVRDTTVDSNYVRSIAQQFCSHFFILCGGEITWHDTTGDFSLIDGPHELYVAGQSGGWEYQNTGLYGPIPPTPPVLPDETIALSLAESLLNSAGWRPADALAQEPVWLHLGMVDEDTGYEDPDSSFNMNISVGYYREYLGYAIVGPGANLDVTFGDGQEVVNLFQGGWRNLDEGPSVTTISSTDALIDLTACGSDIAIGSMPLCDTFLVDSAYLGYYEDKWNEDISQLEIVWILDGTSSFYDEDQDTTYTGYCQVIVPARYRHPQGIIDSPSQDTTIQPGDPVTFLASAVSGTPDYSFAWYSDHDGLLGYGDYLVVDALSSDPIDDKDIIHTIILETTDANQLTDYTTVTVTILAPCCVGLRGNVDGDLDDLCNIVDLVYLVDHLFGGGEEPQCMEEADVNADGVVNIVDLTYLVAYLFGGGPPPEPCP